MKLLLFMLLSSTVAVINNDLYRKRRIIHSMRCMTERRRNPNFNYILYNMDYGILTKDFVITWYPDNLYTLSNSSSLLSSNTNRLRFFRSRVYLDNRIPLFYANIDKRNQC